jgi:hypothetical protein
MKLSELKIIDAALGASAGPAKVIVQGYIRQLEAKTDAQVDAFNRYAAHFGLRPDQLGKVFKIRGTNYRITGLNPGAPRYPINAVRVYDGKLFRVPANEAKSAA